MYGADAVRHELYGESLAGGGLTTRRRTCDENHAHVRPFGNHIGDTGYLLLLKRFRYVDDQVGKTFLHGIVEGAHCADAEDILPAVVLLEDFEHLVLTR